MPHERQTNVRVAIESGHRLLVFAQRQCVIKGGELYRQGDAELVASHQLTSVADSAIALAIDGDEAIADGEYIAVVTYVGLPPVFVGSADVNQMKLFTHSSLKTTRLQLIEKLFHGDSDRIELAMRWAKFDEMTDPALGGKDNADQARLRTFLMNRIARRAAWTRAGRVMPADTTVPADFVGLIAATEEQFRLALGVFHADGGSTLDIDTFRDAFAAFTCSKVGFYELQPDEMQFMYLGVPDGALFLCFAEAAFWFQELFPAHEQTWRKLSAIFVAASPVFTQLYWQPGNCQRTRNHYNKGPLKQPIDEGFLIEQMNAHANMQPGELRQVFGQVAGFALSDEAQGIRIENDDSVTRQLEFQLLERTSSGCGPDATYKPAVADHHHVIARAVRSLEDTFRVRYHDDDVEQARALRQHVDRNLKDAVLWDESATPPKRIRLDRCNDGESRYNPDTQKCDKGGVGTSIRWRLELSKEPTCKQGSQPDTNLEFTIATPEYS